MFKGVKEFTAEEIEELEKYCVLPIDVCTANCDIINNPDGIFRKEKYGLSPSFCKDKSITTNIINYPIGGNSLSAIFKNENLNSTFKLFKTNLIKLLNICRGIQFLQNHSFIHGDIKGHNSIEINGSFKLIDIGDVRNILTTETAKSMPTAFMYIFWPSIAAWTATFDQSNIAYEHYIDEDILISNYEYSFDFNENIIKSNFNNIFEPFITDKNKEYYPLYTTDKLKEIEILLYRLKGQKLFIPNVEELDIKDLQEKIKDLMKHNMEYDISTFYFNLFHKKKNVTDIIEKYNNILAEHFDISTISPKLDFFKRIDVYSLGILLLRCIRNFIKFNKTILTDKECKILLNFIHLVYSCCIQKENVADINVIVNDWESYLNENETSTTDASSGASSGAGSGAVSDKRSTLPAREYYAPSKSVSISGPWR